MGVPERLLEFIVTVYNYFLQDLFCVRSLVNFLLKRQEKVMYVKLLNEYQAILKKRPHSCAGKRALCFFQSSFITISNNLSRPLLSDICRNINRLQKGRITRYLKLLEEKGHETTLL